MVLACAEAALALRVIIEEKLSVPEPVAVVVEEIVIEVEPTLATVAPVGKPEPETTVIAIPT